MWGGLPRISQIFFRFLTDFTDFFAAVCGGFRWGRTSRTSQTYRTNCGCEGIQPERLNAEGFSPRALSRGWSVSVTLGMQGNKEKASERRENSRLGSRYSRSSHLGGRYDTEGYASLHPRLRATRSARAFDLSGRAAVIGGVGIQPERLNAEGFSPRALSRGWSVSVTLGMPYDPRKASERRECCGRGK